MFQIVEFCLIDCEIVCEVEDYCEFCQFGDLQMECVDVELVVVVFYGDVYVWNQYCYE